MDLTEDALLEAIQRILSGAGPEVLVAAGDDAAVVRPGSGDLVLTGDALVEGTHFELGGISPRDLGFKAIVAAVGDVAAMAGSPRHALCMLNLTDEVDAAWVMELFGGMREACADVACSLVGGNLARSREVSVTLTILGEVAPGRAVTRSGARPGEVVVVTGTLGLAAAGLRLARRGPPWSGPELEAIRRHSRPQPRVGEAQVLAAHGATAMIDVSDGFAMDMRRLCVASGVGARIDAAELPVEAPATLEEALGGGEDYELIATLPSREAFEAARDEMEETFGTGLAAAGVTVEGQGDVVLVDAGGGETRLEPLGWDHFR